MLPELDEHMHDIWRFVARYKREHNGCSPAYAEIGKAVNISSKDHVKRDLGRLETAGCIRMPRGVARGIELLRDPGEPLPRSDIVALPWLGVIHAGAAIPTLDQNTTPIDWIDVARNLVGEAKNMYLLQVAGDSMIDALVNDGDKIVMEQTEAIGDGDMVAVWLKRKHATTLKRFYRKDGWIILRPENPTLKEEKHRPGDVEIQGKVVCVIRSSTRDRPGRFSPQAIRPD